jgi:glycerol kinase
MIVKATLDAIAIQVKEVFDLIGREARVRIHALKVDGGATANAYLMQRQADFLDAPVLRTSLTESTAWGAAKLAGSQSGFWPDLKRLDRRVHYTRFSPRMGRKERSGLMVHWRQAIKRLLVS